METEMLHVGRRWRRCTWGGDGDTTGGEEMETPLVGSSCAAPGAAAVSSALPKAPAPGPARPQTVRGAARHHHVLHRLPGLPGESREDNQPPKTNKAPKQGISSWFHLFSQQGPSNPRLRRGQDTRQEEQQGNPRALHPAGRTVGSHPRDMGSPSASHTQPRGQGAGAAGAVTSGTAGSSLSATRALKNLLQTE